MLTPSEVDLLRQDLQAALKVLGQDELDDAHGLLRARGLAPADFEVIQRVEPSPEGPSAVTGTITVVRKGSGASRTYQAGSGAPWLVELEADLRAGTFR